MDDPISSTKIKDVSELNTVSTFRRLLPQFLASSAKNFLIWNLGLILAFPSIVIPSLTGVSKTLNPDETLQISAVQASWLASSVFIGQPLGSVLSAFLTDGLGRRKTMLLVNIPNITAWLLLARTNSLTVIYFAFASFGFGAGLCEAPIMTYLGEICEPSIRGILMACAGISSSTGIFMVFFLGSIFSWRQVALICAIVPIMTLIAVFFVPETPIFLISKRRTEDALNSLRWLRGWVSPEAVANEFHELQRYNELSNSCASCQKQSIKCSHSISNFRDKFKDMTRKRTLKPFILITILYILMEFSGMFVMRPYIVQILNAYGVPLDANLTTVILGLLGVAANLCLLAIVKFVGKRKIYLWSMVGTFLSCFALSVYGFVSFPVGWSSFQTYSNETLERSLMTFQDGVQRTSYMSLSMFLLLQFCVSIGVSSIPNIMMGEVFPFKSRSYLCGVAAANRYILASFATKTYYNIEMWFSLPGAIGFYGLISLAGFVVMYYILPETEQRSLEDIEVHYSDNQRCITDINIRINT